MNATSALVFSPATRAIQRPNSVSVLRLSSSSSRTGNCVVPATPCRHLSPLGSRPTFLRSAQNFASACADHAFASLSIAASGGTLLSRRTSLPFALTVPFCGTLTSMRHAVFASESALYRRTTPALSLRSEEHTSCPPITRSRPYAERDPIRSLHTTSRHHAA